MTPCMSNMIRICALFGFSVDDITSRRRGRKIMLARIRVAEELRKMGYTYAKIGEVMQRDHTSAQYMCKPAMRAKRLTYSLARYAARVDETRWVDE